MLNRNNTAPDEMTAFEVRASMVRGNRMAVALRDPDAERRFRYRHAIFILAMHKGFIAATKTALALANGDFTEADATAWVRKVFAEGKAEQKERQTYRPTAH